ncbi:MAG: site-specific integrase [Methylacidiphilales bacterium]|nr:site-specific integrase [Candidatus Methylacidiphilales bacterium]
MATLVKDSEGRSPYWIACYTAADGRRLKKSTKETVRAKALEMALTLERAETMAARNTLTETRARELIGEVLERTSGESLPFYTAESWLRDWLRGKEVSKSAGTHVKYSHTVEGFLSHLGKRAKLNLAAIGSKDIAGYRDAQISSGKHPNTVHYLVKQLRIPFNAARRQGIITHNPAESVELPGKMKSEDGGDATRDVFTPEQIKALLSAATVKEKSGKPVFEAGQEWRGAILFAYYTGARLQDVANVTWSGVDLPAKTLTYRAKKTGKLVTIPLHPELESHLLELPAPDSGKAFVFPNLAGKGTGGRSGLSMAFSRIMARAGIVGEVLRKAKKGGQGRTVRSLTFHSLRHSFNSAMANAGVAQEIRMKLTGHTSAEMNKGYTHLELEPLRTAIGSIPAITGKQ